ncbi:hypothetical protein KJ854_06260 [Patescibacteria group bacterium]|nr:hypothetical protein [Patescibacteria group bacterium]
MNKINYFLAQSKQEIEEAFLLIYKEYVKQGYLSERAANSKLKVDSCFLLPDSATFISKINHKIIGTVSVAADSRFGLPMDEIYKEELDELRGENKKIAEVCRLAINNKKHNNLSLLIPLLKLVVHFGFYKEIDFLCVAINPKHNSFYSSLFFQDIGKLKSYPSVNGAPALAKILDLNKLKKIKARNFFIKEIIESNPPDYNLFKKL